MIAKKHGAAVVGIGATACVACCASPILGFLAAIGLGAVAGFALFGTVGLTVAVIALIALYLRRQGRPTCRPVDTTVQIEAPRYERHVDLERSDAQAVLGVASPPSDTQNEPNAKKARPPSLPLMRRSRVLALASRACAKHRASDRVERLRRAACSPRAFILIRPWVEL